jgi:RNA polymerase sigma factor for flagellar operon FliA
MMYQASKDQRSPSASAVDKRRKIRSAPIDPVEIRPLVAGTGPQSFAKALDVERERLILEHLPQVRIIAWRIHERLPESVNLDDMISAGTIGLIAAIDRFDPSRGVKLRTYAEHKIRGAILDSLRSLDWAPRGPRRRAKQVEAAISAVEQRLHRSPTEDEIARQLELSLEEYHEWLVKILGVNLGSLEVSAPNDESLNLLTYSSDDQESWPSRLLEKSEEQALLDAAIEQMPRAERVVISLYFHEELTLREIAKVVNLHESRVSQIKTHAIQSLRSSLEQHVRDGEFSRYLASNGPKVLEAIHVRKHRVASK